MASYNWDDLRENRIAVEWGEDNIHRVGMRRPRSLEWKKNKRLSNTVVIVSTLGAIGIAALVALTLVKSPLPTREDGNASKAEGMDLILSEPGTVIPTFSPAPLPTTSSPTDEPSPGPTPLLTTNPTIAASHMPSMSASLLPSTTHSEIPSSTPSSYPSIATSALPSAVPKAPPAPRVMCIDEPGFFHNHAGDKVSCDWFSTVGTYNFHKNCGKTAIGHACLYTCKEYNNCIVVTDPPTNVPSSSPSSAMPSGSPTPEPPNSITLIATGDATVKESTPTANLGSSSWLHIDGPASASAFAFGSNTSSGAFHVLLRFDLSKHDSTRPIKSAEVRLKAANSCSSGGYLQRTHSPHWDEKSVTWASAPEGDGTELSRLGMTRSGYWYSFDVASALATHLGHKTLSLRLYPVISDECLYVSKDNNNGGGPELHIEYLDDAVA